MNSTTTTTPIAGRCTELAPEPGPHILAALPHHHRLTVVHYRAKVANATLIRSLASLQLWHDNCLSRAGIAFLSRADDFQKECVFMEAFWREKRQVHSLLVAYQATIHDCEEVDVRGFLGAAAATQWMEWMESCWALIYSLRDGYGVNTNTCHVLMCERPLPCVEGAGLGPLQNKWYEFRAFARVFKE